MVIFKMNKDDYLNFVVLSLIIGVCNSILIGIIILNENLSYAIGSFVGSLLMVLVLTVIFIADAK